MVFTQDEMLQFVHPRLKERGIMCRKIEPTFLRPAEDGEVVVTKADNYIEVQAVAQSGDHAAVNNATDLEEYVAPNVETKYDMKTKYEVSEDHQAANWLISHGYKMYKPLGTGRFCLHVTSEDIPPGGTFMTRFNNEMIVLENDYLVFIGGSFEGITEVYRVEGLLFSETYEKFEFGCDQDSDEAEVMEPDSELLASE